MIAFLPEKISTFFLTFMHSYTFLRLTILLEKQDIKIYMEIKWKDIFIGKY